MRLTGDDTGYDLYLQNATPEGFDVDVDESLIQEIVDGVWDKDINSDTYSAAQAGGYMKAILSNQAVTGVGSQEVPLKVQTSGGDPIIDVEIWISESSDGVNIVARGQTKNDG